MPPVSNYVRFWSILNRIPMDEKDEYKKGIISQYTQGRTESLKEMSRKEYNQMCDALEQIAQKSDNRERKYDILKKKRSALLHQLQKMGVNTADWSAVDKVCMNPRIIGKPFRKMTDIELEEVKIKLYAIERKNSTKQNEMLN